MLLRKRFAEFARSFLSVWKENLRLLIPLAAAIGLLLLQVACYRFFKVNKSFFNPLFQALPMLLAFYAAGWIISGRAAKIFYTVILTVKGIIFFWAVFLAAVFKLALTPDIFAVLAASSVEESREFIAVFTDWKVFAAIILLAAILIWILRLVWKTSFRRSKVVTVTALVLMLPFTINCIRFVCAGESSEIYEKNLETRLGIGYLTYRKEFNALVDAAVRPALPDNIRRKDNRKMVCLLVVGESATRNHWGLYGYLRDTTPQMSKIKNELLVFKDVITPWAVTTDTCKMLFTNAEFPGMKPLDHTVFAILRAAGWKVVCISNQYRWGRYDGPVNILYSAANEREFLQEKFRRGKDDNVLERVQQHIEQAEGSVFLVLHLMGSHAKYADRYPDEFKVFDGRKDQSNAGFPEKIAREINAYDNSILFTDHLLGKLVAKLRSLPDAGCMLYFADHGEIPQIRGGRSIRSTRRSNYEVPFIFWANDAYKKAYPAWYEAAAANVDKPFQTDHLDYSIVSMAQTEYKDFPAHKDLFSPAFSGREQRFFSAGKVLWNNKAVKPPFVTDKKGELIHVR